MDVPTTTLGLEAQAAGPAAHIGVGSPLCHAITVGDSRWGGPSSTGRWTWVGMVRTWGLTSDQHPWRLGRGQGATPGQEGQSVTSPGSRTSLCEAPAASRRRRGDPQVGKSRLPASPSSIWGHRAGGTLVLPDQSPMPIHGPSPLPSGGPYSPCSSPRLRGCGPSWTRPRKGWPCCVGSCRPARRAVRGFAGRPWRSSGHWVMRPVRRKCCSVPTLSCGLRSAGLSRRRPGTRPLGAPVREPAQPQSSSQGQRMWGVGILLTRAGWCWGGLTKRTQGANCPHEALQCRRAGGGEAEMPTPLSCPRCVPHGQQETAKGWGADRGRRAWSGALGTARLEL